MLYPEQKEELQSTEGMLFSVFHKNIFSVKFFQDTSWRKSKFAKKIYPIQKTCHNRRRPSCFSKQNFGLKQSGQSFIESRHRLLLNRHLNCVLGFLEIKKLATWQ